MQRVKFLSLISVVVIILSGSELLGFYDPSVGKFLSRDPLEEQGGVNLYAFCNNDPINHIDYLGLDAYIVYRKLNIAGVSHTFPATGHVYLAFDGKNMGRKWKKTLNRWAQITRKMKMPKPIEANIPINDYHTFSFHPASVRGRIDAFGNTYRDFSGDRASVVVTDTTDVIYRDIIGDIEPIADKEAILALITTDEDEQIRLFETAAQSWLINSSSQKMKDYKNYSVAHFNCGDWAIRMVRLAKLNVPSSVDDWNNFLYLRRRVTGLQVEDAAYYYLNFFISGKDLFSETIYNNFYKEKERHLDYEKFRNSRMFTDPNWGSCL